MRNLCDRQIAALALAAGALVMCPAWTSAQVIHGELQAKATGANAGIAGAVVQLLDSLGGGPVTRTLSDERGTFVLHAPAPGHYYLRARRIGFRPVTSHILWIATDTNVVLPMVDAPVILPAITSYERTECHIRPDSGLALANLWEDAKTALISAEITRESSPYAFQLVNHARLYDFTSGELLGVALNETKSYDTRSWVSLPPEDLRRDGYVRVGPDSTTFVAPDIQTLLSTYFADTHCLRIGAHQFAPDSLIGVDFDPVTNPDHVEIRGTIWLSRQSHNLNAIDFHYVNLDLGGADSAAGGRVEFAPLTPGGWVLTDWSIRMPTVHVAVNNQLHPTPASYRRGGRTPPTILETRRRIVPDQLHVSGGTLRGVFRDSTPIWTQPVRSVAVHVTAGPARVPIAHAEAIAYLMGTHRWVKTDSSGTASFNGLVHGSYLIEVSTAELDVLGWPRERVRIDVGGKAGETADVQLQSPLVAARTVCGDDDNSLNESTGVIVGSVKAGDVPIADRAVTLSWIAQPQGANMGRGMRVTRTVRTLSGDGRYLLCGVPRETAVLIHIDGQDATHDTTTRIKRNHVVEIVDTSIAP
jgi:hypothetical protein